MTRADICNRLFVLKRSRLIELIEQAEAGRLPQMRWLGGRLVNEDPELDRAVEELFERLGVRILRLQPDEQGNNPAEQALLAACEIATSLGVAAKPHLEAVFALLPPFELSDREKTATVRLRVVPEFVPKGDGSHLLTWRYEEIMA